MPLFYGASTFGRDSLRPARIVLLLLLVVAFSLSAALGQVVIRERVGITPSLPIPPGRALVAQDSGVVLYLPVGGRIKLSSNGTTNCNYLQYLLADPLNFVKCGSYEQYVPGNWKAGTPVRVTAVLYPVYSYRQEIPAIGLQFLYGYTYVFLFQDSYYNLTVTILPGPDLDHFRLTCAPDTIAFADTSSLVTTAVDAANQEVALDNASLLTFSVDSTTFGKFMTPSGAIVGSPLSGVTYGDARAGRVKFIASESLTCSLSTTRVQVTLASDISKKGTGVLAIKDPSLLVAGYSVHATADTIAYGDTTSLIVTALNAAGEEILIKPSTLLRFTLDSAGYGSFITPGGAMVLSPLIDVTYSDARAGKVKFVANGARDVAALKGLVVSVTGAGASGSGMLYLGHVVVSFTGSHSLAVFPHYPGHNVSAGTSDSIGADLSVTFLGEPRPGAWVQLTPPLLADNGGHSHGGARPVCRYSIEQPAGSGVWLTYDTLFAQVNSQGTLHIRLMASPAGGKEIVAAQLWSDATARDSVVLWTRVPELVLLPDGANYVKVGGADAHTGPSLGSSDSGVPPPDEIHYGTPEAIRLIQAIADSFALYTNGMKVTVGHMSLKYGGLFDSNGDWGPDHGTHRLGTNVDLPFTLVTGNGGSIPTGNLRRRLHRTIMNLTDTESLDDPEKLQMHVLFEQ